MKISAIISTFKRRDFLRESLEALFAQTRLPDEILIGDDSPDTDTEKFILGEFSQSAPVPIHYVHNGPSLTEARNMDALHSRASGTHILHLHDDDPVLPCCLQLLSQALIDNPQAAAAFGLQYLTDQSGQRLIPLSEEVNRAYFRTTDRAGLVDGFFAGAVSMFPNNGFLIESKIAAAVGYDDKARAGSAVDYYFGLRLGALGRPMVFVPEYTATVRITEESSSRIRGADNAYRRILLLLSQLPTGPISDDILSSISHHLPFAIANAAQLGRLKTGWQWFFSPYFRSQIFSPTGMKCALRLLFASVRPDSPPAPAPTPDANE